MNDVCIKEDRGILVCPHCPDKMESYLHHGKVTIYNRNEDAPQVTKIEVSNGSALINKIDNGSSGNPSARRDGLAIRFECEFCGRISELTIAQHKGQTLVEWR